MLAAPQGALYSVPTLVMCHFESLDGSAFIEFVGTKFEIRFVLPELNSNITKILAPTSRSSSFSLFLSTLTPLELILLTAG
jgi:hypothetical protein